MAAIMDSTLEPSAVHMYICRVTSRALSTSGFFEAVEDALPHKIGDRVFGVNDEQDLILREDVVDSGAENSELLLSEGAEATIEVACAAATSPSEASETTSNTQSRRLHDSFADLQPLDFNEDDALAAAIALSKGEPDAGITDGPTRVFGRVAGAFNAGVAYVEGRFNAIGDKWESLDHAAEDYAQRFEGAVKEKAIAISCKSRSSYQDIDAAAGKYSQHLGNMIDQKAKAVTGKVKAISQAASGLSAKTSAFARGKMQAQSMKNGSKTARGPMTFAPIGRAVRVPEVSSFGGS